MSHTLSPADVRFREDLEAGCITPAMFDHRSHIRLACVYLAGRDTDTALRRHATDVLTELGMREPPIDPDSIAARRDIEVVTDERFPKDCFGALVRRG